MCWQEKGHLLPYRAFDTLRMLFPYLDMVEWQGGEVLLVDYFKDIFTEISRYPQVTQRIHTNGMALDRDWIELIVSTGSQVNLSVDALEKSTYENIRKGASFDLLIKNLQMIAARSKDRGKKTHVSVNTVIMKRNYRTFESLPQFCKEYGISEVRFDFLKSKPEAGEGFLSCPSEEKGIPVSYAFFKEEDVVVHGNAAEKAYLKEQIAVLEERFRELGIDFECTFRSLLADTILKKEEKTLRKPCVEPDLLKCYSPWERLFIDFYGDVRPDCMCTLPVGNILNDEIGAIWNSTGMQEYRRRILEGRFSGWCTDVCVEGVVERCKFDSA